MIPKSTLGTGNRHKCFKIFDEYCSTEPIITGVGSTSQSFVHTALQQDWPILQSEFKPQ